MQSISDIFEPKRQEKELLNYFSRYYASPFFQSCADQAFRENVKHSKTGYQKLLDAGYLDQDLWNICRSWIRTLNFITDQNSKIASKAFDLYDASLKAVLYTKNIQPGTELKNTIEESLRRFSENDTNTKLLILNEASTQNILESLDIKLPEKIFAQKFAHEAILRGFLPTQQDINSALAEQSKLLKSEKEAQENAHQEVRQALMDLAVKYPDLKEITDRDEMKEFFKQKLLRLNHKFVGEMYLHTFETIFWSTYEDMKINKSIIESVVEEQKTTL